MILYNENGIYDSDEIETVEQFMADKFITEDDCVLELGARYGSVSIITNKKLKNRKNHVVVEPDETVWESLEKNKQKYGCEFEIVKGIISSSDKFSVKYEGYSSYVIDSQNGSVKNYPLENFNYAFNVLIADCEGGLEKFLDEYSFLYEQLNKVIMEEDKDDTCNYKKIKVNLMKRGFIKIFEHGDYNGLLHSVWIKVTNHPVNYVVCAQGQ